MICAPERKWQLGQELALVEAQIGEIRRILASGLPCDTLLATIGEIQTSLEEVAAAIPGLCGETCQFRLTPEEFRAEFECTFACQLSGGCRPLTTRRCALA